MLVSVIVPVYNTGPYLDRCIRSILQQTYHDLEIILINDGSTDNSLDICLDFANADSRVKVISKINGGVSSARNAGIDEATGSYCLFVDSDDEIRLGLIKHLVDLAFEHSADIATCGYRYVNEGTVTETNLSTHVTEQIQWLTGIEATRDMLYQRSIESGPVGKLISMQVIAKERFLTDISTAEDLEFNCRVFLKSHIIVQTDQELYIYWQRKNSAMNMEFKPSRMSSLLAMAKIENTSKNHPELKKAIRRRYFIEAFSILEKLYRNRLKFADEYRTCVDIVVMHRTYVAKDSAVHIKHRLAAIVSYGGIPLLMKLHFIIKKVEAFRT